MKSSDVKLLERFKDRERLSNSEMSELWLAASQFVSNVARRHYQSVQRRGFKYKLGGTQKVISNPLKCVVTDSKAYDKTMLRLQLFLDFILDETNQGKHIPWYLFVYRCRFALFEFVLDAKLNGLGIIPDVPITKLVTCLDVKRITECQALLRKYDCDPTDLSSLRSLYATTTKKRQKTVTEYLKVYSAYIQARFPHVFPETYGVTTSTEAL